MHSLIHLPMFVLSFAISFPFHLCLCSLFQAVKTGVEPFPFSVWSNMRTMDNPDPVTGSLWINDGARLRSDGYTTKFKERNGVDADPLTSPLDIEAIVLAGGGKANGRLWIGDGFVDPRIVPSLRQVRRGRAPGAPAVETRPRVSSLAVEELRVCSSDNTFYYMFSIATFMTSL